LGKEIGLVIEGGISRGGWRRSGQGSACGGWRVGLVEIMCQNGILFFKIQNSIRKNRNGGELGESGGWKVLSRGAVMRAHVLEKNRRNINLINIKCKKNLLSHNRKGFFLYYVLFKKNFNLH
jgi:hypothetical protein